MQTLTTWLGKYNISTHTLGIAALALTLAFEGYKPFHDLVTGFYTGLPTWLQVFIGTGGFLYALYKSGALKNSQGVTSPTPGQDYKKLSLLIGALGLLARYQRLFMLMGMASGLAAACMLVTGCAVPMWLEDATNLIPVLVASATSILSFIAGLTGNAVAAEVLAAITAWSQKIEAGLRNIETLVASYKATPDETVLAQIEDVAQLVVSDLAVLDGILGIPPALAAKLQAFAQLILTQLTAWLSLLPALKASATAGATLVLQVPMTSAAFKAQHNALLAAPTGDADVDGAAAAAKTI